MLGFIHAIRGIILMIRSERNFKIQLGIFICLIILCLVLKITPFDWVVLLLVSASVFTLEVINSSIEKICDLITLENNKKIKDIKDISAGAVLIASVFAVVIGAFILFPYLF